MKKGARAATTALRKAAQQVGGSFEMVAMDLSDLASVRSIADRLVAAGEQDRE